MRNSSLLGSTCRAGMKGLRLTALLVSLTVPSTAQVISLNEYPLPTANATPLDITVGPDGALWFVEYNANKIGRITVNGLITEYAIPTPGSQPNRITPGPDGALWFTEEIVDKIGRITVGGVITEYKIPTPGCAPVGITAGPDGALWFTEWWGNAIGRLSTAGVFTEYKLPTPPITTKGPEAITVGPDGALWFTEQNTRSIGRITTSGALTEYPTQADEQSLLLYIAAGRDGALWFTDGMLGFIYRITTSGLVTQYGTNPSHAQSAASAITVGADGALWFADGFRGLGRITTDGQITRYALPELSYLRGITSGPDGALWSTDFANKIWQAVISVPDSLKPISHVSPLPGSESLANFMVQWSGTDAGGSGLRDYTIYVSDTGGPFTQWQWQTTATRWTFAGTAGHSYGFYCIARDWAGNLENAKTAAEATTYVASAGIGDVNGDGQVNCADLAVVKALFGRRSGQAGFDPRADVNHDGIVDVRDLATVSQQLVPGTKCP